MEIILKENQTIIDNTDSRMSITTYQKGGLASFLEVKDKLFTITPTEFSEYSFPLSNTYIESKQKELPVSFEEEIKPNSKYAQSSKDGEASGSTPFDKLLNEVSSNNPAVRNLRKFLTETARAESNFDFNVQNKAGAPAYGAFQFMDFNIKPLGVSVEQFRNNPKLQLEAAANLAAQFKSQFTEEDKRLAKEKGYNENALLAGAWLGGVGGVRKVLRGQGNPSDKHWSKEGKGTTVKDRMDKFNKMQKGGIVKPSFEEYYKTVPLQKNDTTNYNLRRAYELVPYKDMVRFAEEPKFHLNSAYKDPTTGIYNFVKSKKHPTVQLELDWYNSPEGVGFKNQYDLDTTGEYYKYIPKKQRRFQKGGILKYENGNKVDPAILEYWKKQNVVLPSPKNEQVSSDSRTKELRNYQETQQQVNQNLEKGKHLNFWTQPYANFSGRQAAELGTNLFKQSLYAGVGDVTGTYALAGLGLALTSGIKLLPKSVKNIIIAKAISKIKTPTENIPNNVGWGPKQSIKVIHDKNTPELLELYYPNRWDAVTEGAPKHGIWFQGKFGDPRTILNNSIAGKAEKAYKARKLFENRPFRLKAELQLDKPISTIGDVPNRASIERFADKIGSDGVIFNDVYDNGYANNQVIFSFRNDLRNIRLYRKANTPNYTENHLELTKTRLRNGMANKLAKNTKKESGLVKRSNDLDIGDKFDREYILNKQPEINAHSTDYGVTPEALGVGSQLYLSKDGSIGYFTGLFKDSKALVGDAAKANNIIESHEFSHLAYRPTKPPKGITTSDPYFTQLKGTEQTARGTQIKNYFGISDTSPITKKMWEYAKENYVKDTGMDNRMTEWFNSVTNPKDYLKWLNKHTPAIVPAVGGTATYLNNDNR